MTRTWIDQETGEVFEGECPRCLATVEECEAQVKGLEMDLRTWRNRYARAEKEVEKVQAARRDKQEWEECLAFYRHHFPDKKMTATGIRSERATWFFKRREAGASMDDVKAAIYACTVWRWVSFGRRVKVPHDKAQPAIDLLDMLKNEAMFDAMVSKGYEMKAKHEAGREQE